MSDDTGLPLPDAVLAAIEASINHVLALDPEGAGCLAEHQGRVLLLELIGFGTRIYCIPGERGMQLYGDYAAEPDCTVRGTPAALLRMALARHREDAIFAGFVTIDGDNRLAQGIGDCLYGLDIDWEEQLARVLGDTAAHRIGVEARGTRGWARRSTDVLTQDLREYLIEEARLVPSHDEVRAFTDGVDHTRDDCERLAARVERLLARRRAADR
jgi:ubiquinone biosynthesis protein UbiJ